MSWEIQEKYKAYFDKLNDLSVRELADVWYTFFETEDWPEVLGVAPEGFFDTPDTLIPLEKFEERESFILETEICSEVQRRIGIKGCLRYMFVVKKKRFSHTEFEDWWETEGWGNPNNAAVCEESAKKSVDLSVAVQWFVQDRRRNFMAALKGSLVGILIGYAIVLMIGRFVGL